MYACALVLKIPAQMFGQGLDCSLGGVVGCVAGRVGNSLFTARDDDTRRFRLGGVLNDREKCVDAMNNAEKIGFQCLVPSVAAITIHPRYSHLGRRLRLPTCPSCLDQHSEPRTRCFQNSLAQGLSVLASLTLQKRQPWR